jgi:D-alanine-D-alanine ligase
VLVGLVHTAASPCRCAEFIGSGLRALGHRTFEVDADRIERSLGALAAADLVFDSTDTVAGRGLFRAVVRGLLEQRGARVAGPSAAACLRADDKVAMRAALERAGVPVAPGAALDRPEDPLPASIPWPRILKPCFEHMSRGVTVASDEADLRAKAADLHARFAQPLVVERFIEGREVGVTVLGTDPPRVLPAMAWDAERATAVISWDRKLQANEETFKAADLDEPTRARLERTAVAAFRALDFRDYARFDVRIDAAGTPFFIDANTRPSLEESSPTIHAAARVGLSYNQTIALLVELAMRRPKPCAG